MPANARTVFTTFSLGAVNLPIAHQFEFKTVNTTLAKLPKSFLQCLEVLKPASEKNIVTSKHSG